nr:MAG TPA: hypothetical protein [Bacteriophage sp.]
MFSILCYISYLSVIFFIALKIGCLARFIC